MLLVQPNLLKRIKVFIWVVAQHLLSAWDETGETPLETDRAQTNPASFLPLLSHLRSRQTPRYSDLLIILPMCQEEGAPALHIDIKRKNILFPSPTQLGCFRGFLFSWFSVGFFPTCSSAVSWNCPTTCVAPWSCFLSSQEEIKNIRLIVTVYVSG